MNSNNIKLIAVGDISFGDHFVCMSFGINSFLQKNPTINIFEKVKNIIKDGDIKFCNLETVLSNSNSKESFKANEMRGSSESIKHLIDGGFNVVNIANNHMLQHGEKAFFETIDLLKRNNLKVVGLSNNGYNCEPCILEINGIEIIFLGYSFEKERYWEGKTLYAKGIEEIVLEDCYDVASIIKYFFRK